MLDKYKGCLIGGAIGDALGMPLEFLSQSKIIEFYHNTVDDFVEPHIEHPYNGKYSCGEYTDDTELTIAVAKSLIESNLDNLEQKLGDAFKNSRKIGWGRTCKIVCTSLAKGKTEQGLDSTGSGAAMRIAPVGLVNTMNQQGYKHFIDQVHRASSVTHDNIYSIAGSMTVAAAVDYVRNREKVNPQEFMTHVLNATRTMEDYLIDEGYEEARLSEIIEDNITEGFDDSDVRTVVPLALRAFINNIDSFENAVVEAANQGGDADTIAAITGAISGAYHGLKEYL